MPDEVYAGIVNLMAEEGAVELASAIAWENYRARFNRAFDVGGEGFCSILDRPVTDTTDAPKLTSEPT